MRKSITLLLLTAAIASITASADDGNAILGGLIGVGAGSALGYQVSGRHGAAVGAAVGGVVGAVIGANARPNKEDSIEADPVVVHPVYYPITRAVYAPVRVPQVIYAPTPAIHEVVYVGPNGYRPYWYGPHWRRHLRRG